MFYIIGVNPNIERADRSLMEQIWIEKYRPNNLSEVVGQEAVTTRLKNYVKESSMPHLLFAGPAGIGKTITSSEKVIDQMAFWFLKISSISRYRGRPLLGRASAAGSPC